MSLLQELYLAVFLDNLYIIWLTMFVFFLQADGDD